MLFRGLRTGFAPVVLPAFAAAFMMPAPAGAAPPSGQFQIANDASGLCLSPAGGGRGHNDEIVQYYCDSNPSRRWNFVVVKGDALAIMDVDSSLCLTIAGGSRDLNARSVQYACDGDASRLWTYEPSPAGAGRFRLRNLNSGLCLTIAGASTVRNVVAVQYACDGDPSRDWYLKP